MKPETRALLKIEKVIESCETPDHIIIASRLVDNYECLFKPKRSFNKDWYNFIDRTRLLHRILSQKESEILGF